MFTLQHQTKRDSLLREWAGSMGWSQASPLLLSPGPGPEQDLSTRLLIQTFHLGAAGGRAAGGWAAVLLHRDKLV